MQRGRTGCTVNETADAAAPVTSPGINRGVVSDPAAPFGEVKQSGIGREGAREGMREYQETQYFSIDFP